MSPIASAKLEFRTKISDPKHQLFGEKNLVIYTPYGEIYRVSIKARTTWSYWTVQLNKKEMNCLNLHSAKTTVFNPPSIFN